MKPLSNFTRRALVVLGSLLSCGNTQAEEFELEWEVTFRPFEFVDSATEARVDPAEIFPDEKGGCVLKLTVTSADNLRQEFIIFLDQHGEEKYRLEVPLRGAGYIQFVTSERALIQIEEGNTSELEVICFSETGEVIRTSTPNTFGNLDPATGIATDFRSFKFSVIGSDVAGGLIGNVIFRKFSFGSDDSPEPAPVLFSGVNGDNAIVAWKSRVGSQYQVQKSSDLQSWSNIGLPIMGTGEQMNYSEANLGEPLYLRIVVL